LKNRMAGQGTPAAKGTGNVSLTIGIPKGYKSERGGGGVQYCAVSRGEIREKLHQKKESGPLKVKKKKMDSFRGWELSEMFWCCGGTTTLKKRN